MIYDATLRYLVIDESRARIKLVVVKSYLKSNFL